jgi:PPOX class probable F420-dependent enzyme
MATPFESLTKPRFASLTTWRRNGTAVSTPVWIAVSEKKAYVMSRGPGKVKRIRNNPAVTIAPCTIRGRVRGTELRAVARVVGTDCPPMHVRRALRRKYGPVPRISSTMAHLFRKRLWLLEIEAEPVPLPSPLTAEPTSTVARRDRPLVAPSRVHPTEDRGN